MLASNFQAIGEHLTPGSLGTAATLLKNFCLDTETEIRSLIGRHEVSTATYMNASNADNAKEISNLYSPQEVEEKLGVQKIALGKASFKTVVWIDCKFVNLYVYMEFCLPLAG